MSDSTRERIFAAALTCFERDGLVATSLEDVARTASLGRATIYRQFPGGREQLVSETVTWEVARFFGRIEDAIADEEDLGAMLVVALGLGHDALAEHALLQSLLRNEPGALLSELAEATDLVLEVIIAFLAEQLDREVDAGRARADLDRALAADHLGRLYLSFLGSPGRWDLDDPDQLRRLVDSQFLAGLAP